MPSKEWTREAHLTLARACAGEADMSPSAKNDWLMIAYTLARWWKTQMQGWSFRDTVIKHTMLRSSGQRAWWAGSLPWGPLGPGHLRKPSDQRHWRALLVTIWQWGEGWEQDPCPAAVTWSENPPGLRARANANRAGLVRLACPTNNVAWGRP